MSSGDLHLLKAPSIIKHQAMIKARSRQRHRLLVISGTAVQPYRYSSALHARGVAADTVVLARSSTVPVVPVIRYRYMYTSSGARATFRHHARAEEALQYSSLIATEELTELLKPVVPCPSNIFRCDTRPAKPLDLCLVDLY